MISATLPEGLVRRSDNHLAEGEVTGHYHDAFGVGVSVYDRPDNNFRFLQAPEGATIFHQEHGPVTLPVGSYDVVQVKEYDHFLEESRAVRD